jgi:pimeloyl-ACP methyl ester carboxylesterase
MPRPALDRYTWTADGVRLHWRDWPGDGTPLLAVPGLTRNLKDFDALAEALAPRRLVAVSLRGRGESGWAKDPLTYVPLTYLQDLGRVIDDAGLARFVALGSSVGGELAMLLEVTQRQRLAGLVLNDWGPDVLPGGLARLRGQVGRGSGWPTWLHAARDIAERQAGVYPGWGLDDWLAHAKRLCRVTQAGRVVWDYDTRISEPFRLPGTGAGTDAWLALEAFAALPVLSLRSERSDVLAPDAQAAMAARLPGLVAVTVPGIGHAPTLGEPEALAALTALLERADAG